MCYRHPTKARGSQSGVADVSAALSDSALLSSGLPAHGMQVSGPADTPVAGPSSTHRSRARTKSKVTVDPTVTLPFAEIRASLARIGHEPDVLERNQIGGDRKDNDDDEEDPSRHWSANLRFEDVPGWHDAVDEEFRRPRNSPASPEPSGDSQGLNGDPNAIAAAAERKNQALRRARARAAPVVDWVHQVTGFCFVYKDTRPSRKHQFAHCLRYFCAQRDDTAGAKRSRKADEKRAALLREATDTPHTPQQQTQGSSGASGKRKSSALEQNQLDEASRPWATASDNGWPGRDTGWEAQNDDDEDQDPIDGADQKAGEKGRETGSRKPVVTRAPKKMTRYACRGTLLVNLFHDDETVSLSLTHHEHHSPYVDVVGNRQRGGHITHRLRTMPVDFTDPGTLRAPRGSIEINLTAVDDGKVGSSATDSVIAGSDALAHEGNIGSIPSQDVQSQSAPAMVSAIDRFEATLDALKDLARDLRDGLANVVVGEQVLAEEFYTRSLPLRSLRVSVIEAIARGGRPIAERLPKGVTIAMAEQKASADQQSSVSAEQAAAEDKRRRTLQRKYETKSVELRVEAERAEAKQERESAAITLVDSPLTAAGSNLFGNCNALAPSPRQQQHGGVRVSVGPASRSTTTPSSRSPANATVAPDEMRQYESIAALQQQHSGGSLRPLMLPHPLGRSTALSPSSSSSSVAQQQQMMHQDGFSYVGGAHQSNDSHVVPTPDFDVDVPGMSIAELDAMLQQQQQQGQSNQLLKRQAARLDALRGQSQSQSSSVEQQQQQQQRSRHSPQQQQAIHPGGAWSATL